MLNTPAAILQEGQLAGLKALVSILRGYVTRDTHHIYSRAKKRLEESIDRWKRTVEMGSPDFSIIADRENTFRVDELESIWISTSRYGNLEAKRVKSEQEGRVGPLNRLLNIHGALLRDHFIFLFPLEPPIRIARRKNRAVWGYRDDSTGDVPVSHGADLAELDFADMLRSHGRELARRAFISSVRFQDFSYYANLLILKLAPYAEYIYSAGKTGTKGFLRSHNPREKRYGKGASADDILNAISDLMIAQSAGKRGRIQRLALHKKRREAISERSFIQDQIVALESGSDGLPEPLQIQRHEWAEDLRMLSEGPKPRFGPKDVRYLYENAMVISRWEGNRCHRFITEGFVQPFSLSQIITGRVHAQRLRSNLYVATEVPVNTAKGRGVADIVVFRPTDSGMMQPIGVFEVKSRTAFNWEIIPQKKGSKRIDKDTGEPVRKVIGTATMRKRRLRQHEWEDALASIPTETDSKQLDLYEGGLLRAYTKETGETPKSLLKGVFLVDSQEDTLQTKRAIFSILSSLDSNPTLLSSETMPDRFILRPQGTLASRATLVVDRPAAGEIYRFKDTHKNQIRSDSHSEVSLKSSDNEFILYLSIPSASKSGRTAAWIAKYWHGMKVAFDLAKRMQLNTVLWIDLAGFFTHRPLARVRLRIDSQSQEVREFFENMDFIDLSNDMDGAVFEGKPPPDLSQILSQVHRKSALILVSGWEFIERSCPAVLRPALQEIERLLSETLASSGAHIIWFGHAPTYAQTSITYHKRCHIPFWETSPLKHHVTRIIWNLPLRPYTPQQVTPLRDDVRVIVSLGNAITTDLVEIPPLRFWSSRFWSRRSKRRMNRIFKQGTRGRPNAEQDILSDVRIATRLKHDALDLIPWIDHRTSEIEYAIPEGLMDIDLQCIPVYGNVSTSRGILSRMTYQPAPQGHRGRRGVAITKPRLSSIITHPRHYRRRFLRTEPIKESHRPPMVELLVYDEFREDYAIKTEFRRMRRVISLLSKEHDSNFTNNEWTDLLSRLEQVLSGGYSGKGIHELQVAIARSQASSDLWHEVMQFRNVSLARGLMPPAQESLMKLLQKHPLIAQQYGNYIFLMLLALKLKHPRLRVQHIKDLWSMLKTWVLTQVGFRETEHEQVYGKSKFNPRAIWSNLNKRAKRLIKIPLPMQANVRHGRIVTLIDTEIAYSGVFLEDTTTADSIICGFWRSLTPIWQGHRFSWAMTDLEELAKAAYACRDLTQKTDFVIISVQGEDHLWLWNGAKWDHAGRVTIVLRGKDALAMIRGVRLEKVPPPDGLPEPLGITIKEDMDERIDAALADVIMRSERLIRVSCALGVKDGQYEVRFSSEGNTIDCKCISSTAEVISLIRTPVSKGIPVQSELRPDSLMTWDPGRDISYEGLKFLKPHIENTRPFTYIEHGLPITAQELCEAERQEVEVTVRHDDTRCPVRAGDEAHGFCWSLSFTGKEGTRFAHLQSIPHADSDIAALVVAGELFVRPFRFKLNFTFEPAPSEREGMVFRESKRIARALGLKPIPPGSYMRLQNEQLIYELTKMGGGVAVTIRSDATGQVVDQSSIIMPERINVEFQLERFEENVSEFLYQYFGEMGLDPRTRVSNYDDVLAELEVMLKQLKKEASRSR